MPDLKSFSVSAEERRRGFGVCKVHLLVGGAEAHNARDEFRQL